MSEEPEAPDNKESEGSTDSMMERGKSFFKNKDFQDFREWMGYKLITKPDEPTDISDIKERLDWTYDPEKKDKLREIIKENPRPPNDDLNTSGVLLRDEILYYQKEYNLIEPFEPDSLKPAAYELRVGDQYSVEGEIKNLNKSGKIEIDSFEVAVIQTKERVNLPHFLIGRWNIKVGKAYDGLLWVGGPQVDPGFSGYLSCPIYNLSDETVSLDFGEELAVIDFIKTTPFNKEGEL